MVFALALVLRLLFLPLRPPHEDEAFTGWFALRVLEDGFYRYDPGAWHGPLHFYLLTLSQWLFGHNLWGLRLPTVLLGAAAVWLAARCGDAIGKRAAWLAALFLALSPALVLYADWAIHETDLMFFSVLLFHGWCRWRTRADTGALWEIGIAITGALLTKEVWIVHAVAVVAAWFCWRVSSPWAAKLGAEVAPLVPANSKRRRRSPPRLAPVALVCLGVFALLYAGLGRDPEGVFRFFQTYTMWSHRASSGEHAQPWYHWLNLFTRYELPALFGLAVAPVAALLARPPLRLLAIYTGGIFVAYSIISYKTPWLILQLVWPCCFLAGWALAALVERSARRAAIVPIALLAAASFAMTLRVNLLRYTDPREPYIYVQTYSDGLHPARMLLGAARRNPSLYKANVEVVMDYYWPLPWLLYDFRNSKYWNGGPLPSGNAAVLFVGWRQGPAMEARLRRPYYRVPFVLSPVRAVSWAYFDAHRFRADPLFAAELEQARLITPGSKKAPPRLPWLAPTPTASAQR